MDLSGVFETRDGAPVLIGGRGPDGTVVFPCPASDAFTPVPLSRRGTLWSYTTQAFPPKPPFAGVADPTRFQPYHVGYVELDTVIVEARLDIPPGETPRIGDALELVAMSMELADGGSADVFAFRPVGTGGKA
ncbi:MAG: OB-fold domain-containing protein [Pseudomonadota bacterium]